MGISPTLQKQKPTSSTVDDNNWGSRAESVNMHNQLLNIFIETRSRPDDVERTYKTNRGWWIVWMRVLSDHQHDHDISNVNNTGAGAGAGSAPAPGYGYEYTSQSASQQEAFIIRRASDYIPPSSQQQHESSGARFFRDLSGAAAVPSSSTASPSATLGLGGLGLGGFSSWSRTKDLGPGRLVEGLGFDPRRYVDGLLGLNR